MEKPLSGHELHHELFGSVIDKTEMNPYLLLRVNRYDDALIRAAKMMGNRGFDTSGSGELQESEKKRALAYAAQVERYFFNWMFPFVKNQLEGLKSLRSENSIHYYSCLSSIARMESILTDPLFQDTVHEDPRHLFLLASSRKHPRVFSGYRGRGLDVPPDWQLAACSILKMGHLIKSVEEDSQDINDYAQLGLFLEMQGQSLDDLYNYDWENPRYLPESESAQKAFVKISTFFHKLRESLGFDEKKGCLVFQSGDGVDVEIAEIKSRLKSPESMFTKLGKDLEGEAHDIRDILAITFILRDSDDTLKLVHALQKRGVILQENTLSHSITQTLFDSPLSMISSVRELMISLARSEGSTAVPSEEELHTNAKTFYEALGINAARNPHSSLGHRKFQCKINFSVPIHRTASTNNIMIPGTPVYARRHHIEKKTQQHTLSLELRISDRKSWRMSEQKGDSHHDAYKFRQIIAVMNRVFKGMFHFPPDAIGGLRKDQVELFPEPPE